VKLLFDENLSPRLVGVLSSHWPGSTHVEFLGMRGASDEAIWAYARDRDLIIVLVEIQRLFTSEGDTCARCLRGVIFGADLAFTTCVRKVRSPER
jgi:hypothetical protein